MARIKDILTEAPQHVSFCFGRMNPPHYGHEGVIKTVQSTAKGGAWAIFVSKSHDNKKNPLSYDQKIKWIQALYPQTQGHLVEDPAIKTVLAAAAHLYDKGFRSATFIAGEDDMPQMRKLLEDYNGAEGKSHGFYKFDPLTFVESPRLTSATNARQAAMDNNPEAFEIATRVKPNITVDGKTLFQAVRSGMGLSESISESKNPDLMKAFADFMPLAMKELNLTSLPKIKLEKHVAKHDQPTFARYVNDEYTVHLAIQDRQPMDILRTLAHELVHFKQQMQNKLDKHSGDTGSAEENEARAEAGVIMRHFAKEHPGYFQDSAVTLDENFKDGRHPEDKGDSARHGIPKHASISSLRKIAKQGGRKGQLAHWQANMRAGKKKAAKEDYGATSPTTQLGDRAVAVMPFDRFAVKMDENWEPNLFEVSMSPGALNDFAKSEIAQTMTIGFEMELAIPDLPDEGGYSGESETEADMEYNDDFPTGSGWRNDVISWLHGGDNPNGDRAIDLVMEWFDEQFFEYADEMFMDALDGDEDLQEEVRKEIHDLLARQDKPSDAEAIAAEYDEQTDIYTDAVDRVKDEWQTDNMDNAFDDFCMRYRIRDMEDFLSYVNRNHPRISLSWPYLTYSGGDGEGGDLGDYLQDVANELEAKLQKVNSAFYVAISNDYHDESREVNKFIIEPDGSISPQGREFISPPMQFADGLAAMQIMFEWANRKGYRTNDSTGFHMGISLPNHETQNIDHMKFILMLGDQYVLEKFNRAKAHYAVNTVNTMRDTLKRGDRVKKEDVAGYLRQMATGMQDLATTELNKLLVPRGEHRQSVNIKRNYMEIRSAGDNYLPRFDEIRLTLLRYLRTLEVSADDQAYRREYAKKLSKFLTSTEMIRTVDPKTGRKGVAAKDTLDKTVQQAFDQYFAALQRGESGDAAIAELTAKLNEYKGNQISTLKKQLISKRANADVNASKLKYSGSDRVEFSAKGSAYDVINSFIEQMRDAGMSEQHQRALTMEAPRGQILYSVEFSYRASTNRFNYWCFATSKADAIAQAKKAWNTGADQPGDSWLAYEQTGDGQRFYYVIRNYLQGNKTPPALPVDRSDISHRRSEQPEGRTITYSLRSHDDRGIVTFTTNNDQSALSTANQLISQHGQYNHDNTVLFRYGANGVDRERVWWQPEQPTITGRPGEPRPAFTQPQANAEGTPGTFIVTYLSPQGNEQQTAYDANSATEAATLFRLQHPASYRIQQIERLRESVGESAEVTEAANMKSPALRKRMNNLMNKDQNYTDPTQRGSWQEDVWRFITANQAAIFADVGPKGNGDYPAAPFAAWLLVQHMDAHPERQREFYMKLRQAFPDHPKLQFLKDRAAVNAWIQKNANNPEYYYKGKPLPDPTVNVRNPAMFKDAGIVATSRKEALKNAINAGNKLLVGAVRATKAKTQPSYTQSSNESQEVTETLKKVKGKWALVSRHKPEKVLQYYHGSGHPSKEWVSKVERRVHSFESQIVERREIFTDIMPDGDITYTWHREQRSEQRKIHFKDLIDMAQDAVKLYRDELAQQGDGSFVIKRKSDGLGIGVIKTQRPDGTYGYHVATTHYNFNARPGQKVYMVEAEESRPKFKVYLDMDGVLADFFGEWARLDGKDHYKDIDNPQAKLELIRKHPTFWVNLPMLPHARELIRTVKELFGEYYICSTPLAGDPRSEPGKMAWIRDHLADMPPAGVILTHNKAQHANTGNGPNILIDDYGVNVNAWKMAGGIALKYEDTTTVSNIQHVKKMLANFAKTGVQL